MLEPKLCTAFLAVIETGSFDLASKKLNITASAVSIRIQTLEKRIGVVLVTRTRPCKATSAGLKLQYYLQQNQLKEQKLLETLQGKGNDFFTLKLGINADSLATWFLPNIMQKLLKEKILLEIHLDDQSQTHFLMETGKVHACIATENQPMHGCHANFIGKMRYFLCANKQADKLWFKNGITRASLQTTPAVLFNQKDNLHHDYMLAHFGLMKTNYPISYIPSSESFVEAIRLGLGCGFIPEAQLTTTIKKDVKIYQNHVIEIDLYWHHWQEQNAILKKLTKLLTVQNQNIQV